MESNSTSSATLFGSERFSQAQIELINKKLEEVEHDDISYRQGIGGVRLAYIEGWKVIKLANDIFGFNGWSTSILNVSVEFLDSENGKITVGISSLVRVTLKDGSFHEDVGFGSAENFKSKATAFEKAKKEAVTDATKRALRHFGYALGLSTYDKEYLSDLTKNGGVHSKEREIHEMSRNACSNNNRSASNSTMMMNGGGGGDSFNRSAVNAVQASTTTKMPLQNGNGNNHLNNHQSNHQSNHPNNNPNNNPNNYSNNIPNNQQNNNPNNHSNQNTFANPSHPLPNSAMETVPNYGHHQPPPSGNAQWAAPQSNFVPVAPCSFQGGGPHHQAQPHHQAFSVGPAPSVLPKKPQNKLF